MVGQNGGAVHKPVEMAHKQGQGNVKPQTVQIPQTGNVQETSHKISPVLINAVLVKLFVLSNLSSF